MVVLSAEMGRNMVSYEGSSGLQKRQPLLVLGTCLGGIKGESSFYICKDAWSNVTVPELPNKENVI